ncbi:MAG TPA: DUF1848 domain-containing protein [Peptococcaceae bacterium]|nr:DUF1848 domain-containing protein [Peptococcaceae bacterium]
MIISVSRRTDIPAFFTEWFFNRLREGFALVRNPFNYHQVFKVKLDPSVVDCIVFWTKNPGKILPKLKDLSPYNYYFQITLNAYDQRLERYLPPKEEIIKSFQALAEKIGKEKTIWRYDPIILTKDMDVRYHAENFGKIASQLKGYTERCIISFVYVYQKTERNLKPIKPKLITEAKKLEIAKVLAELAGENNFKLMTCCEQLDLSFLGIEHARCIDDSLISRITGRELKVLKDKNQREVCGCVASVDLGAYNSCRHGCLYCYANYSDSAVKNNVAKHDPNSPLLIGSVEPGDKIKERR